MKFDAYEYVGVTVPGSIIIVTLSILYPDIAPALGSTLSLGDFGLILILAFVAGHILQAIGNLWELIIWHFAGGMPTSWVAKEKNSLLTKSQVDRLARRLQLDFGVDRSALSSSRSPMREIFVRIRKCGKTDRIEKFNRNYGLMRGIAAAFIVAAGLILIDDYRNFSISIALFALSAISTYRMIRFGSHYAREIYAEYLNLPSNEHSGVSPEDSVQGSTT